MIEGDFEELGPRSVKDIINKGGTVLKSARSKEFMLPEGRAALDSAGAFLRARLSA